MRYAVLVYGAPGRLAFTGAGVEGGVQLQPVTSAVTVRVQGGQMLTTEGPFPEMKDDLVGFCVLEAGSREEAIEFAARLPPARLGGAVEVRPLAAA